MATSEMVKHAWRGQPAPGNENQAWDFGTWTNPLLTAPLVYLAGIILNMASVDWWWPALGGLGFVVSFYAAARSRGLRKLGVGFTVASGLVGTGWLVYSSLVLTFNVLDWGSTFTHAIAGVVITIPLLVIYAMLVHDAGQARVAGYLAHHEPPTNHRQDPGQVSQVWAQITRSAGIKKWTVAEEPVVTADAITVVMRIQPGGTTYRQALTQIDALELAANAAFNGAVRMEQPAGTGVATVVIRQALRSTLADLVKAPPVPPAPRSILQPVVDAQFEDGEPSGRIHAYQSVVTIGQRDSGKSGLANVRIDAYAAMSDCLLWIIDFKEGRLVRPWLEPWLKGQVDTPVFDWVGSSVATVDAMVSALIRIGKARGAAGSGDKIEPTPAMPAIRLIIDEVADLLADQRNQGTIEKLIYVIRKLRSEGVDVDLASQRATMSFLGAKARDVMSQTTIKDIMRVDSAAEVYNTLQISGSELGGVDAGTFVHPGTKLTLHRGSRVAAARTVYLDPVDIPARAAAYASWRPSLEASAAEAAGTAYANRWNHPELKTVLGKTTTTNPPTSDDTDIAAVEPIEVSTPAIESADETRTRFIEEHGKEAWEKVQGRMALIAARSIIGSHDHILTQDLLNSLAIADPARWGGLDAKSLAALVRHHGVEPANNLGPNRKRGYTKAAIEASFDA